MSSDFETALLRYVAPRLSLLGYEYDARLRVAGELFGFRKPLGNEVQAIIQYQRRDNAGLDHFTVNLIRMQASEIRPRLYVEEASTSAARLSYVLWFVHGLRDYPAADFWWTSANAAQQEAALLDTMALIERHGVPWLESLDAPKPWEMPAQRGDELAEAVQAVMAIEMERLGYHLQRRSLPGNLLHCYFSKPMPDRSIALIELQSVYSLDPGEFTFDVRLQRRRDSDPLDLDDDCGQQRSMSLAHLVWREQRGAPLDGLSVSEAKTLLWHYHDRAELDAELSDALERIKQLGCAWIEQAAPSKMIQ